MNKKLIPFLLANTLIISTPLYSYSRPAFLVSYTTGVAYKLENIIDIKPKHWAYNAVKYVLEDLGVMEPKTPTRFLGDKTATRYELARTFYNAAKGLEDISEKDLRINAVNHTDTLTDVNTDNKKIVNSIVNEYGIMQLMPDNKFMGNREMTRYELSFDLNNYLMLLEKKIGEPNIERRDRLSQLTDVSESHWAYQAIKNIVDKYKIMDGYPQNVFGGDQKLTRYEVAAIIKKFVEYVDKNILSMPQATPTPVATPEPTPVPTPVPTPEPTPEPVIKKSSLADIKVGYTMRSLFNPDPSQGFMGFDPGVTLDANFWWSRFGFGVNGEYLFNEHGFVNKNAQRISAGGTFNWRIIGFDSDEDPSIVLGLGYGFNMWTAGPLTTHGPKAEVSFEVPVIPWFSLIAKDSFMYYAFNNQGWRNDVFAGFGFPATTMVSGQIGYAETRYSIFSSNRIQAENGLQANLRFRF